MVAAAQEPNRSARRRHILSLTAVAAAAAAAQRRQKLRADSNDEPNTKMTSARPAALASICAETESMWAHLRVSCAQGYCCCNVSVPALSQRQMQQRQQQQQQVQVKQSSSRGRRPKRAASIALLLSCATMCLAARTLVVGQSMSQRLAASDARVHLFDAPMLLARQKRTDEAQFVHRKRLVVSMQHDSDSDTVSSRTANTQWPTIRPSALWRWRQRHTHAASSAARQPAGASSGAGSMSAAMAAWTGGHSSGFQRLSGALQRVAERIGPKNSIRVHNAFRDFAWRILSGLSMPTPVIYELRRRHLYSNDDDELNDLFHDKNTTKTVRWRRSLPAAAAAASSVSNNTETAKSIRTSTNNNNNNNLRPREPREPAHSKQPGAAMRKLVARRYAYYTGDNAAANYDSLKDLDLAIEVANRLRSRLRLRLDDLAALSRRTLFGRIARLPFKRDQSDESVESGIAPAAGRLPVLQLAALASSDPLDVSKLKAMHRSKTAPSSSATTSTSTSTGAVMPASAPLMTLTLTTNSIRSPDGSAKTTVSASPAHKRVWSRRRSSSSSSSSSAQTATKKDSRTPFRWLVGGSSSVAAAARRRRDRRKRERKATRAEQQMIFINGKQYYIDDDDGSLKPWPSADS